MSTSSLLNHPYNYSTMIDLLFIHDDFDNTLVVTLDGRAQYEMTTPLFPDKPRITLVRQLYDAHPKVAAGNALDASLKGGTGRTIAEIQWKVLDHPTIIRSKLLASDKADGSVRARRFLQRRHRFSPCSYFVGDDGVDYRWKVTKGVGCALMRMDTRVEIAASARTFIQEGLYAGEVKPLLQINPDTSLDLDLLIMSFLIVENKRKSKWRERYDGTYKHGPDDDPGDGGSGGDMMGEA
ncbi:hypothetical protein FA15DRAFT_212970 [Coprinopsis marcescibilis]|uniref:DUF6593 domain-containing protein n=1 Tax=Coprinopsis marcescibilis TaxID=230819 RepID=A0A5C3L424_COPMA|nr:hypothetical protein FA15DRAFT_212970 [Coprinopsis marcescibilis]